MSYTLTKRVDKGVFATELVAAGVPAFSINNNEVRLTGEVTDAQRVARLAIIARVEEAHVPTTFTAVSLLVTPHIKLLTAELNALGVSGIGVEHPASYPGTAYILHNPASPELMASIKATAEAHDPTSFPRLTADTSSTVVVPSDGTTTRSVIVSDSRGGAASGKTVRLKVPGNVTLQVNSDVFVLDAAGKATAVFGPSSVVTGEVRLGFHYVNEEADSASFSVRFGTP